MFIIGCGRSGTSILGKILQRHQDIRYFFEPYHLWSAIDPTNDVLGLYTQGEPKLIRTPDDANEVSRTSFRKLFFRNFTQSTVIVEKTPLNAFRIGYLRSLQPNSRFIHIVRDGGEVITSIKKLSTSNTYRIAGKPELNQWWGIADIKWKTLKNDGMELRYLNDELPLIEKDPIGRAAYEWLLSLRQVEEWREILSKSLLEIRYDDLINYPDSSLRAIAAFIGINTTNEWLNKSISLLTPTSTQVTKTLMLPPQMSSEFNRLQEYYAFPTRSVSTELKSNISEATGVDNET